MIGGLLPETIDKCDVVFGGDGFVYGQPDLAPLPPSADQIVLLVHGFNVGQSKAAKSYERFKALLANANPALLSSVRTLAWPGWRAPGPLNYPSSLRNAGLCADRLVRQIQHWYHPGQGRVLPPRLVILAHSMGCRLVLEALARLRETGRPSGLRQLDLVLMAAAVPGGLRLPVNPPSFEAVPQKVGLSTDCETLADQVHVLHSAYDVVLLTAFPAGQVLAREGWRGQAVGLRGRPFAAERTRDMGRHGFTHGSYWKSARTVEAVSEAIGLVALAGPGHELRGSSIATNALPTAGELPLGQ